MPSCAPPEPPATESGGHEGGGPTPSRAVAGMASDSRHTFLTLARYAARDSRTPTRQRRMGKPTWHWEEMNGGGRGEGGERPQLRQPWRTSPPLSAMPRPPAPPGCLGLVQRSCREKRGRPSGLGQGGRRGEAQTGEGVRVRRLRAPPQGIFGAGTEGKGVPGTKTAASPFHEGTWGHGAGLGSLPVPPFQDGPWRSGAAPQGPWDAERPGRCRAGSPPVG